jgi:hypothetical protein
MKLKRKGLVLIFTSILSLFYFWEELGAGIENNISPLVVSESIDGADHLNLFSGIDSTLNSERVRLGDVSYLVDNKKELFRALSKAKTGEIVYVDDSAKIDLSNADKISIPSGVILASGGWNEQKKGALLYSYSKEISSLFITAGDNVRITGLRIIGPDYRYRKSELKTLYDEGKYYSEKTSLGISTIHKNVVVDHCELAGWGYAALKYHGGASDGHVAENYIHHNQRWGLGYGVVIDNAKVLIEKNVFDWNRHAIAGSGTPGTSYEARYNSVRKNSRSHAFDMHGGVDRKDGTDIAGDFISIHNNIFYGESEPAIKIRGKPQKGAFIYNNCFYHKTIRKAMGKTPLGKNNNIRIYDNYFGKCEKKI